VTVSTSDPTLPARLPSRYEALSIDVTTDPVECVISLLYPNGNWDMVYQDGVFANTYRDSTRVSSHFEIVRAGGWPSGMTFELKVKESTPALSTLWDVIYDVDMTAQASQTILGSAVGSSFGREATATIDGKSWTARTRSISGLFPTSVVLTNGTGVVITCNNSPWHGAGLNGAGLHLDLATQLPAWDSLKQTAILAHITTGTMDTLQDGAGVSSINWSPGNGGVTGTHIGAGFFTPSVSGRLPCNILPGTPLTTVPSLYASTVGLDHTVAIVRRTAILGWAAQLAWAGSMPLLETMIPFAQVQDPATTTAATGFAVYLGAGFNKLGTLTIKRIQVLQPI
jgi:hypothetical protein